MDVFDLRSDFADGDLPTGPGVPVASQRRCAAGRYRSSRYGGDDRRGAADWGLDREQLTHTVLTHWHADHTGSAAEIARWPDVQILAHRDDAPIIRGEQDGDDPVLTEAEKVLHAQIAVGLPDAPPTRVDHELDDGDVLTELDARIIATPGHTAGSLALRLAEIGVLFTGDIAADTTGR